jgi:hypothetical protein
VYEPSWPPQFSTPMSTKIIVVYDTYSSGPTQCNLFSVQNQLAASNNLHGLPNPSPTNPAGHLTDGSPRALAQMGRRETEREGGKRQPERERGGNPAAFVFVPRPGRVRLQ